MAFKNLKIAVLALCLLGFTLVRPAWANLQCFQAFSTSSRHSVHVQGSASEVEVVRNTPAGTLSRLYARTNRGYEDLVRNYYGPQLLNPLVLKNKRILDAGCGDGQFVKDLRNILGITALGVDIHLNDVQKKYPQYFQQADLRQTHLPSSSFDLIFSTWSVISYEGGKSESIRLVGEVVHELDRILSQGGRILISPAPLGAGGSFYVIKLFQSLGYQVSVLNHQSNKKIPSGSSVLEMIKGGRR